MALSTLAKISATISVTVKPFYRLPPVHFVKKIGAASAFLAIMASQAPAMAMDQTAPLDRPVLVAPIHYSNDLDRRVFVASIKPRVETDHGFRVAGKVAKRLVDVGQEVAQGDVLAILDETDFRLQKEQAEAELTASAMVVEQTATDEKRGQALREKGWSAQVIYDRQRSAAEEARSRNKRAQRAVELANNALTYSVLRADSAGVVTAVNAEPGQVMAAGQPAIRIARKGEKEALVALPETFLAQAKNGKASLSVWAVPGRTYAAVLREISPIADAATRSFAARFSLPDADAKVALGMSATLTIFSANEQPLARIPMSALFDQGKGPALWRVESDGRLTLKPVTIVRYEGRDALISGGVAEGDHIVILGVQKLDAAQKVRTISQIAF